MWTGSDHPFAERTALTRITAEDPSIYAHSPTPTIALDTSRVNGSLSLPLGFSFPSCGRRFLLLRPSLGFRLSRSPLRRQNGIQSTLSQQLGALITFRSRNGEEAHSPSDGGFCGGFLRHLLLVRIHVRAGISSEGVGPTDRRPTQGERPLRVTLLESLSPPFSEEVCGGWLLPLFFFVSINYVLHGLKRNVPTRYHTLIYVG